MSAMEVSVTSNAARARARCCASTGADEISRASVSAEWNSREDECMHSMYAGSARAASGPDAVMHCGRGSASDLAAVVRPVQQCLALAPAAVQVARLAAVPHLGDVSRHLS